MKIEIYDTKEALGRAAAAKGSGLINEAIGRKGTANIIVATGASQFEMLEALRKSKVDWSRVTAFHLDEYIGLPVTHPASFRKYLKERFVDHIPIGQFHYVNGETDPLEECKRLGALIESHPIDVAFVGIGENGHLAFNDPPADFQTEEPYIVVNLDEACRKQQFGEGWFPSVEAVPETAISMSVKQILKSGTIICSVPDRRKADAVRAAVEEDISPEIPASILTGHRDTWLCLDKESSSLLSR